jgi:hypothetical protein
VGRQISLSPELAKRLDEMVARVGITRSERAAAAKLDEELERWLRERDAAENDNAGSS